MPAFVVVSPEGQPVSDGIYDTLVQKYGEDDTYAYTDTCFLVNAKNTSASELSAELAFNQGGRRGVVLKLAGSYHGFARRSLWEWMRERGRNE